PHDAGLATWHAVTRAAERVLREAGTDLQSRAQRGGRATEATLALQSQRLLMANDHIRRETSRAARAADHGLHRRASRTGELVRRRLQRSTDHLDDHRRRLAREAPRRLDHATATVRSYEQQVQLLDPVRTMARGWSITRTGDGKIVRSIDDMSEDTELITQVADGRISSRVQGVPTSEPGENA
ncbi:MAG: exodeoxyribonuclease VII large subunit, partial [Acidimicrobiales bacterium]